MDSDFLELKNLLIEYDKLLNFDHVSEKEQMGVNVWIVHISGQENTDSLTKVLNTSPLRFDSHVFGFYEDVRGNLKFWKFYLQLQYPEIFVTVQK